jgi:phage tail-like protein
MLDGEPVSFVQVSGLEAGIDWSGDGARLRPGRVALSRGIFAGDLVLWTWAERCRADPQASRAVTIELLDSSGNAARRWALTGVRPVRIAGPLLDAMANAVAIETLEIDCEAIAVS